MTKSTKSTNSANKSYILYPAIIAIIAIVYAFVSFFVPLEGDDLAHIRDYAAKYPSILYYPKFIIVHWLNVSGRWGNHLMPMMMSELPVWVTYLLNGVMTAAFFAMVVKLSGFKRRDNLLGRLFMVALLLFTMPWWDSMILFCCSFNYVWATVIALAFLWVLFKVKRDSLPVKWLSIPVLCVLAGMAGSMHEALSLPVACGLAVYFYLTGNYRYTNSFQRLLLLFFALGVLMALSSPGVWARVGSGAEANDPMWLLVLKSDFYALLLVVFIVWQWARNRSRFEAMVHSEWVIFAVAAIVSTGFSAVGGIVGRSGWFAQVFALMSLVMWLNYNGFTLWLPLRRTWAVVLFCVMTFHLVVFATTQCRLSGQFDDVVAQYEASPDGVVYYDYTGDEQLPWWLLHKCRGVPDPDDTYIKYTIAKYHGNLKHPLVIVPRLMLKVDVAQMPPSIQLGDIVVTNLRPKTVSHSTVEALDYQKFEHEGITYVVEPFSRFGRQLYLVTPRDLDPGDR